jgi:nucleoid-associated protein YgaU
VPLTVSVNTGTRPTPQIVTPAVVIQEARASGNPNAARALAVTIPIITIDQRGLYYATRGNAGGVEFRFLTGQLRLTLRQSIYISNVLSSCAQGIWAGHEQDHVKDNQKLMARMDREIRAHRNLKTVFFSPSWRPRSSFNAVQRRIHTVVGSIFEVLTREAVRKRDTLAEYARVKRTILRSCPGPYYYEVQRGDTLSKLALFFYGNYRFWRSIYNSNRSVIGREPDLIHPGQQLVIPKNP